MCHRSPLGRLQVIVIWLDVFMRWFQQQGPFKGASSVILVNFSIDQMVIELTKITKKKRLRIYSLRCRRKFTRK